MYRPIILRNDGKSLELVMQVEGLFEAELKPLHALLASADLSAEARAVQQVGQLRCGLEVHAAGRQQCLRVAPASLGG